MASGKRGALSGAGLGLEDFRKGGRYREHGLDGRFEHKRIGGCGERFQTVQLEISKKG